MEIVVLESNFISYAYIYFYNTLLALYYNTVIWYHKWLLMIIKVSGGKLAARALSLCFR